jgi:Uma2 family endonuclease
MTTSTAVPLEEYLRTCYEPDAEYVDGQLVERNVGEWSHSLLQALISSLLVERGKGRFRVMTELRMRVTDEPRYRIPDICVVSISHPYERFLTRPPHLAIEIVSPDDEPAEMLAKIGEYLAMGIPHIWVADPYKRRVVEADTRGIRESASRVVETDLVGAVDFNELFAQLDEAGQAGD